MKTTWLRLCACLIAVVPFGCQPAGGGIGNLNGSGDNGGGINNDNVGDNANLPADQFAAIDAAARTALSLSSLSGAAYPSVDVQAFLAEFDQVPTCPTVDFSASTAGLSLTVDYGEGCPPVLYPEIEMSGSVTGTFDVENVSVAIELNSLVVDDETISGSVTATADHDPPLNTLVATFDITVDQVGAAEGTATLIVDTDTGAVTIPEGTVTVSLEDGTSFDITFEDLIADPVNNGNFLPESGTATFTIEGENGQPVSIELSFTENTPVDGSIEYSINENP